MPLYVWLPDAMAGPTPVSALIHAATMVTAGVYLVARTSFLFALAPAAMAMVTLVGAVTALFAAAIAFAQNDIKKVLAYSTVSQLGYHVRRASASGAFFAGELHLVTHAFFKACLFLGAGLGHARHGRRHRHPQHGRAVEEDARTRRGPSSSPRSPSPASLPLSGFFSKDAILAGALFSHNAAVARGRHGRLRHRHARRGRHRLLHDARSSRSPSPARPRTAAAQHAHESSPVMTVPLWILAVLSVVALFLGLPALPALGSLGRALRPLHAPGLRAGERGARRRGARRALALRRGLAGGARLRPAWPGAMYAGA